MESLLSTLQVSVVIPDRIMREHGASDEEVGESRYEALKVSIRDIRLVQRIGNKDVIVDQMEIHNSIWSDRKGEKPLTRMIPSTDIEIDVDSPEDRDKTQAKRDESKIEFLPSDTYRNEVEKASFEPILETPPFYPSIIDELRNKYSKFRIRHTDDF